MRKHQERFLWLGISILGALTLSPALLGQSYSDSKASSPLPTDWSQHHLIFSKPATAEQARRVERDPRYWQQQSRQSPISLLETETGRVLGPEVQPLPMLLSREGQENNKDWSQDLGSGATVGATNYPAKYGFQGTTATCAGGATQPDFVVYGTGLAGSATQASIVAYDNIYSGCSIDGPVPTVYWAYNTSDGTVTTSPVFSQDGTQVAFVQTDTHGNGILVVLRWAASTTETVGDPQPLMRVLNSAYPGCTAPCMTSTFLEDASGNKNADTNSSVFYDYSNDTAYVGDDAGWLHQFSPVFKGIPTEVKSGGWPVQVNPLNPTALASPVNDYASGIVMVTDAGGFLYRVGPNTAFVATSGQLDFSFVEDGGPGIVQGPIVDSTSELVYVFAASDGSGKCIGGTDCTAVYQLAVDFPDGNKGSEAVVGASTIEPATPNPLYIGAFDSTYENSVNATGHLYVCGNTGGPPILYQVPITAGVFGTVLAAPVLANTATPCSPVTDILNPNASLGPTEWIFASAQIEGIPTGCSGGCIFNFKVTSWQASTLYTVGQEVLVPNTSGNLQVEVVTVAGTSSALEPTWHPTIGGSTTDGTVHWLDQGVLSSPVLSGWKANNKYTDGTEIVDPNDNIELVKSITGNGDSGASPPSFSLTAGGTVTVGTAPNTVTWENVGAIASADAAAAGGTSGIIIDNFVGSGTLAGASQVYFSTLSDQACGTSGTGGCAVQASQAKLQ